MRLANLIIFLYELLTRRGKSKQKKIRLEMNISQIAVWKLLLFNRNTWNFIIVYKLLVSGKNT